MALVSMRGLPSRNSTGRCPVRLSPANTHHPHPGDQHSCSRQPQHQTASDRIYHAAVYELMRPAIHDSSMTDELISQTLLLGMVRAKCQHVCGLDPVLPFDVQYHSPDCFASFFNFISPMAQSSHLMTSSVNLLTVVTDAGAMHEAGSTGRELVGIFHENRLFKRQNARQL